MPEKAEPNLVLYTRNGFAGPMATLLREQYPPAYTSVSGTYAPRILDLNGLDGAAFSDPRALPVAVLTDPKCRSCFDTMTRTKC
jgi:homogentisate 1,2-dioxygenase